MKRGLSPYDDSRPPCPHWDEPGRLAFPAVPGRPRTSVAKQRGLDIGTSLNRRLRTAARITIEMSGPTFVPPTTLDPKQVQICNEVVSEQRGPSL